MGGLSRAIFGRGELPERCIIYAGAYLPKKEGAVRGLFESWGKTKGNWIKYAYAKNAKKEILVIFNVYGGALLLEVLHILKEGDIRRIFFIGSMYAKALQIGTLVIPCSAMDKAGLVMVDDPGKIVTKPLATSFEEIKGALEGKGMPYVQGKIASVPCVFHGIDHVKEFIDKSEDVLGVEAEVSTFYHFTRKLGLKGYVLLYVSDNRRYSIMSEAKQVREVKRRALRSATQVALVILN